jgi:PAS domain S-box-containing protein
MSFRACRLRLTASRPAAVLRQLVGSGSVFLSLLGVLFLAVGPSLALDEEKNIDQYGHDTWTSQNGLPGETVYQILQSPDGYLWSRTSAGLVRFDGARFVLVNPIVGGQRVNEPVKAICLGSDGDLLVRTVSRTLLYKNGVFSDYLPLGALPDGDTRQVFETKEHELFVGSDGYIYRIRGATMTALRSETGFADAFVQAHDGTVWIGTLAGLFTYRDDKLAPFATNLTNPAVRTLAEDHAHVVWVGMLNGLYRFEGNPLALKRVASDVITSSVVAIQEDRQGNLWVATNGAGLFRRAGGKWSSYTALDGLADNNVFALYEDREGDLWVGTASGLERFRDTKFIPLTAKDGLPGDSTSTAIEGHDGSMYVFCDGAGLARIKDGVVKRFTAKDGLGSNFGASLYEAKDGSVWIGTTGGLTRLKDGKLTNYTGQGRLSKYYISAISEDEEGLIVATARLEILRFKDGAFYPFMFHGKATPLSRPGFYTFVIYRDPSGTLWFGTVRGLFKFASSEPIENAQQRQVHFPVTSIYDDHMGNLWLGGRVPGITRFRMRDGRVTRYSAREGLFEESPTRILSDRQDNLWVSTRNGIYSVNRKDLDAMADGQPAKIQPVLYGIRDGMKTSEASAETNQPAGWRTEEGKLWFTTKKGVVIVDPDNIPRNPLAPPVIIEEFVADGRSLALGKEMRVAPGRGNFEFHYTAPSLSVPERVQFRYKLEGYDRDWIDPGQRRAAFYTNLSPGKYRFRVMASNDDGVWNETGASVVFAFESHVYQTVWFYALCILAVVLGVVGAQRLHTRSLRLRAEELGRIVDERTKDVQAERTFLRQVIDTSPNSIFVKDRQGRYTLANQAHADLLGVPVENLRGKTDAELASRQEEAAAFRRDDLEVMDTRQEKFIPQEKFTDSHGRVHWLQVTKRPIPDLEGRVNHALGVATDISERKQAEESLAYERNLLRTLIDIVPDPVFVKDTARRFLVANPEVARVMGAKFPEELLGKTDFDFYPKDLAQRYHEDETRILQSGEAMINREEPSRTADGPERWFLTTKVPLRDRSGAVAGLVGICHDITPRKEAEEALARERNLLRTLIDLIPDRIYLKDAKSRFLLGNRALVQRLGADSHDDIVGKTDFDFYPRELAAAFAEDDQTVVESGKPLISKEESSVNANGSPRWTLTTKIPLRDKEGRVIGIAGTGRDITQHKLDEQELRRAKEALVGERNLLRTLIDNMPDCIYVKDAESRFLVANAGVARLMGASQPGALLGKTDFDFFPRDLAQRYRDDELLLLESGQPVVNKEEPTQTPEGERRWLLTTKVPLRDQRGNAVGLVGIGRDITGRKNREAELRRAKEAAEVASRTKSEFLANMSHEIRTPLNGIVGMTDLALETELTPEQREYLETVKLSADSLLTVINDILDFSKIEAGKMDLEALDFDLRDTLEATLKTLAVRADEKGLELLCDIAPEVPEVVRGDFSRLRQVIVNLVGNAIKFTEVGEVALKVQVDSHDEGSVLLHFAVADTGIGIPEEKQKLVFDPFSQGDSSTTRKYGGTGLGLTISARLVEMMGGQIWFESRVGQGTQFHFTVKLATSEKPVRAGAIAPPELLRGVKVLVVDDNRTNRRILEGMLKRWDMQPTCVDGGAQALEELSTAADAGRPYVLVLADLLMPLMDGFEMVEHIRERPGLSTVIIMMLTSAGRRGDAARCEQLGVAAYLLKPIRQSELREAIARVLGAQESAGPIPLVTRYSLRDMREPTAVLRVLLAEDNAVNQRLAVRMLEKRGHRVAVANNGREALAALEKDTFDLVLMDVQMPEMDGFEATALLRKKEQAQGNGTHLPVIALTAHAMKGDRERCLEAGMDGYLSKPIRPQELDEILESRLVRRAGSGVTLPASQPKTLPEPQEVTTSNAE